MRKYFVEFKGNDTFYVKHWISANNIELAMMTANTLLDSYSKLSIEQIRIVSLVESDYINK